MWWKKSHPFGGCFFWTSWKKGHFSWLGTWLRPSRGVTCHPLLLGCWLGPDMMPWKRLDLLWSRIHWDDFSGMTLHCQFVTAGALALIHVAIIVANLLGRQTLYYIRLHASWPLFLCYLASGSSKRRRLFANFLYRQIWQFAAGCQLGWIVVQGLQCAKLMLERSSRPCWLPSPIRTWLQDSLYNHESQIRFC